MPPQLKGPVDRGRLGKLNCYKNLWHTPSVKWRLRFL